MIGSVEASGKRGPGCGGERGGVRAIGGLARSCWGGLCHFACFLYVLCVRVCNCRLFGFGLYLSLLLVGLLLLVLSLVLVNAGIIIVAIYGLQLCLVL